MSSLITAEEIESLKLLLKETHAQHAVANGPQATCRDTRCVEAKLAIAWLTQQLLDHHPDRSFATDSFSMRSILPQCRNDEAAINSFRCSRCAWLYQVKNPQTDCVDEQDAYQACRAFDTHDCMAYPAKSMAANGQHPHYSASEQNSTCQANADDCR